MTEKVFFVAGEASGDQHAAEVIRELIRLEPSVEVHAYGGKRMESAGAFLHEPFAEMASVGLDWVRKVFEYRRQGLRIFDICREHGIRTLVLVDFPGFNLRVATAARKRGLRVIYYIVPQVWAWRQGRLHRMKRDLDLALVLFPFEKTLLENAGIPTRFVGHPLVDRLREVRPGEIIRREHGLPSDPIPLVGLLPGSRRKEIERLGPVLSESARRLLKRFPDIHFVIPKSETVAAEWVEEHFDNTIPWTLVEKPSPDLRSAFRMAITKSGTSTLENALLRVPQVVVYKGGTLDAWIARRVIRVSWLGLVNILAGREICPEFLQENCIPERIVPASAALIRDSPDRREMLRALESVAGSLGPGGASRRTALAILEMVAK